ncbi:MAG TPA: DUF1501 domain-containing protein [Bryobacteraceae bacterium]|nr:DUF1501 domain-containing protein [Bryobacteraceae bacterium]
MTPEEKLLQFETRRHFFNRCCVGVGKIALASLLGEELATASPAKAVNPTAPKSPHFPAKVKNVIYLFMAGAPSQLDLFDYKPALQQYDGKSAPESLLKGKRFAFMDTFSKEPPKLLGTRREFKKYGKSGKYVSELLPNIGGVVDDIAFISGVSTDNFNHGPAKCFVNTGSVRFGRPSIGAWVTYGIGSESQDLPGFVVLESGPRGPRGGAALWSSGFLPSAYQGVPFRSGGDPILDLSSPKGISSRNEQQALEVIRDLNLAKLAETGDPEINTRIAAYEMAYRMQTSGPELIDFSKESRKTLEMYGAEPGKSSYANNCLLARRLVERGTRFVQLYHTDWDHHADLGQPLEQVTREIDRPTAALIRDLKERGLLENTLVIWGGEFGRTPMGESRESKKVGRNHHIDAYTLFMAGGGIKPGQVVGGTDELGFSPTERVHIHDVQATLLHLLGLDHTRLTFKFQGRDFRLTDVGGQVIQKLLA